MEEVSDQHRVPYLFTAKELDRETGLYYFGARYYDPRTSVWQSCDPILGDYLPTGNKEKDKSLPGMGGVFNSFNLELYGYSHLNPVKFVDPDGNEIAWFQEVNTAKDMTLDFIRGTGPATRFFGPGTNQVNSLKNAPKVNQAREYFYKKNFSGKNFTPTKFENVTEYGGKFGPLEFLNATITLNPTRHFVGSFNVDIYSKDYSLVFVATNKTSAKSAFYHFPGNYSYDRWAELNFPQPFSTTKQLYVWTEPLDSSLIRKYQCNPILDTD